MSHLDEGRLMALLDGELTGTDQQDAERHLQSCSECSARLSELRSLMQEADGLVSDLGEPPAPASVTVSPRAERRAPRRASLRPLAWAASIVAALGLGFAGSQWLESGAMESDYAAATDPVAEPPSSAQTPPTAPSPALPEVALRSRTTQPTETGAAITGGAANQAEQDRAEAPSALLSSEAQERPLNLGETAGQSAVLRDSVPAAVAAQGDNRAPTTQSSAKAADQFARLDQPAREETPAERRMAAAPAGGAGLRQRTQATPVFQRVTMEEAVRHLSGVIRLIDGLAPEEFAVAQPDSARPLVRVLYRVGSGENRLFLEQRRADNSFVASDLQRPAQTVAQGAVVNQLSWNDLRGFELTLAGPFSVDSLFHFKTLVK